MSVVLFTVLLGILEYGYVFRDYQISSDAVSDGSRTGALRGPDLLEDGTPPDFLILKALREATGSIPPEWVERIVVFEARNPSFGAPGDQVPASCRNGSATAKCNVYNNPYDAFLAVQEGDIDYFTCPGSTVACSWPLTDRTNGPTVANVDYLGVWMRIQRPYLTGLFGTSLTLDQASIARLEVGALTG